MKQFTEPTMEIIRLEIVDVLTASNDRLSWDVHDGNNTWITD